VQTRFDVLFSSSLRLSLFLVVPFALPAVSALARPLPSDSSVEPRAEGTVASRSAAPRAARARRCQERLEEGPGYQLFSPQHSYGAPLTLRRLREVFERYHSRYPEARPIIVMDISRRGGGRLEPHASHRSGRDVDIRLVLKGSGSSFREATPRTLDLERTWFLLWTLIETGDVEFIFLNRLLQKPLYKHALSLGLDRARLDEIFQLRHGRGRKIGIIRHEPGHLGHFHVRFRRGAAEPPPLVRRSGPDRASSLLARVD
jgi:hypothetical protein